MFRKKKKLFFLKIGNKNYLIVFMDLIFVFLYFHSFKNPVGNSGVTVYSSILFIEIVFRLATFYPKAPVCQCI